MTDEQNREKPRICANCAWRKAISFGLPEEMTEMVMCMYSPKTEQKYKTDFCHHHARTRGWLEGQ